MRKVLFIFGQLTDDDVEWLLAHGSGRALAREEVLIHQGVESDGVYILLEGRLAVTLPNRGGIEIARLNTGEIVGEMSFVDARPPSATVSAIEASVVFVLRKDMLSRKLTDDQGFAARFYRALAMFLSTTVRERHRMLGDGVPGGELEPDEDDELDPAVLDNVYLAGERFDRMVKRVIAS